MAALVPVASYLLPTQISFLHLLAGSNSQTWPWPFVSGGWWSQVSAKTGLSSENLSPPRPHLSPKLASVNVIHMLLLPCRDVQAWPSDVKLTHSKKNSSVLFLGTSTLSLIIHTPLLSHHKKIPHFLLPFQNLLHFANSVTHQKTRNKNSSLSSFGDIYTFAYHPHPTFLPSQKRSHMFCFLFQNLLHFVNSVTHQKKRQTNPLVSSFGDIYTFAYHPHSTFIPSQKNPLCFAPVFKTFCSLLIL